MGISEQKLLIDAVASQCVAVRMRILNRVITRIYDDALRDSGLKVSQMNILVAVAKMGVARPADVCRRLHLDVSTLSRNVERMRARGWLEVVPDSDGRAQPFQLTNAGRKLLKDAAPAWAGAQRQARSILGDALIRQLDEAIRRLGDTL